ncbi:threonylcarbamoyl-AMP synthase [Candidatus Roizmanbacteria bacterium]|nr:threonylcarbamoyl-AMP synthase [Candidatus Roizmanbacteria bacterium]
MKIIQYSENNIPLIVELLNKAGLIVSPSDTVYGLLVDATNEKAVKKLIQFKNRQRGKPISIFVPDFSTLQGQVMIKKQQLRSVKELLPGPFTVILPSKHKVSPLLESEKGTLGVRIPDYQFIKQLVKKFGKPVTATSANLSGRPAHYSVHSLLNELPKKKKRLIDLIIDAGVLSRNKPSTVVDLTDAKIKILRRGDIVFKDEETYISKSPTQTKKIAQFIFRKIIKRRDSLLQKPLIFIIQGELGVGKTVFVKGIGEYLGIKNIISPTFVVYYEYISLYRYIDMLTHVDLYNVQDPEEFKNLGLGKYLKSGNLLCFEWGEKAGEILDLLKEEGKIVYVKMRYVDEKTREIQINF